MIIKGLNPSNILKNREKIARKLIEKYQFTEEDLASFFYMNPNVMGKFLKENNIIPSKNQNNENKQEVERLKIARDKKIKRAPFEERAMLLEKYGLWRLPEIKEVEIDILKDFPNIDSAKQAMEFLQFGFTLTNIKSYFQLNDIQLKIIQQEFDAEAIPTGVHLRSTEEVFDTVKDMVSNGHDYQESVKATGGSMSPNEKRFFNSKDKKSHTYSEYIEWKQRIKERQCEHIAKKENVSSNSLSKKFVQKEALKEEVFRRWMNAEKTQLELAKEYGVDRITIKNWCKEMKIKYRDEIEQPTVRRRNLSKETLKERGLEKYDNPGMMRLQKNPNVPIETIEGPFKKASEESRIKASKISEEIYQKNTAVLFGYGPNTGMSMENGIMKPGYIKRLSTTTNLGKEFSIVPGAREYANTHNGEIKGFWDKYYETPDVEIERE